jgi:protein-L-isoaspartate(D-aspartate) O-methyltransferase
MNIETARFNMIEQQIRPWDVLDQDVLDILALVRREDFVPAAQRSLAFVDTEIPLPGGEFMFAPKLEARILQELMIQPRENALEIGTGSGFMAALLAHQAQRVTTVEIAPALLEFALANLARAQVLNVAVVAGDGARGWPAAGEVDILVVSGSLPVVPDTLLAQLKIGGRLSVIVGQAPAMQAQIITRTGGDSWETRTLFETSVKVLRNAVQPSRFRF